MTVRLEFGAGDIRLAVRNDLTPSAEGGHQIALNDGEVATVTVDADGNTVISIENQPAMSNDNGGNGGRPAPVEQSRRRSFGRRLIGKMSWSRETDGSVTFQPGEGEVLDIDGDSIMAVVHAVPTTTPSGAPL